MSILYFDKYRPAALSKAVPNCSPNKEEKRAQLHTGSPALDSLVFISSLVRWCRFHALMNYFSELLVSLSGCLSHPHLYLTTAA